MIKYKNIDLKNIFVLCHSYVWITQETHYCYNVFLCKVTPSKDSTHTNRGVAKHQVHVSKTKTDFILQ